jgi:septal ring factor EnvC (AmiA/AmiB activator)
MSFIDSLSSARGPGLIGALMALVVLCGFVLFYIFVFDEDMQGGQTKMEVVIRDQATEIKGWHDQLAETRAKLARAEARVEREKERQALEGKLRTAQAAVTRLAGDLQAALKTQEELGQEAQRYKESYRQAVRQAAKGSSLASLTTTSGETYRNVIIREITAVGMQIRHDDGLKRIPYEVLPVDMQDFYQFAPDEKAAALAAEASAEREHVASMTAAEIAAVQAAQARQQDQAAEVAEQNAARIAQNRSTMESLQADIRRLESAIMAERTKSGLRRTSALQQEIDQKKRQIATLRAENNRLSRGR